VFGVDVQSGDVRGEAPSYALVVFDGEVVERDVVSHRKLRRLITGEEPAIVATDNVYELAEDRDALVHLLGELPDGTDLVQVTGDERPEPLSRVAKRHGVAYAKEPMAEAEAAARLAAANVGHRVTAFTNTTEVKVSRGRSTGSGGFSEDRFTRKIHGAVRRRSREVEATLDDAGLDSEREVTEKYGGFANAVFTVAAPPEDIPVTTGRSGDVRVEMARERRDGIEFDPLAKRRDHVVVGVDPGTTTAVALVGIDGQVLDVYSSRTVDAADVTEWIVERGRPVIVAADVTPMPETVEKLRRSFDAAGWTPDSDLPVDEKLHRTREEGYDNDHERDALAAALSAHDAHADQFERIAGKVPAGQDVGPVVARVVAGEEPVEAALEALSEDEGGDETPPEPAKTEPERTPEEREIARLTGRNERLEARVAELEATVETKDNRIQELERELDAARNRERQDVRETREVTRLQREIGRLERELDDAAERNEALADKLARLKELWRLDHADFADVAEHKRDLVPVKPIEQFTRGAIDAADADVGLAQDDVVLLRDASGAGRSSAERLADVDPRLVLRNGGLSDVADEILFEADIPVAPDDDVPIEEVDELVVTREGDVEAAIEGWQEWAREREREKNAELVDRLISEHRAGEVGQGD